MKLSDQITRGRLFVAFGSTQQTGGLSSVDLAATSDGSSVTLSASDGSVAPIPGADASEAGVMTAADKVRLDALPPTTARDFATLTGIAASAVEGAITHLRTSGYAAEGDGGGGLYRRVGIQPGHGLKAQSADGAWWELVAEVTNPRQGGAVGDGVTDDTAAVDACIDYGKPILLLKDDSYYYAGIAKAFDLLDLRGEGTLKGNGQSGFAPNAGANIRLDGITIRDFDRFIDKDTTGVALGDFHERGVKWRNLDFCIRLHGTGSYGTFYSGNADARGFRKCYALGCHGWTSAVIENGYFEGEVDWDGVSTVSKTSQAYVAWFGDGLATVAESGHAVVRGNTVRNIVCKDGRADGFLTQQGKSFNATGNDIRDVVPNVDFWILNGYLDYNSGNGSGLYASHPDACFAGNTLFDAGSAQIVCTPSADRFKAVNNTVVATPGKWVDRCFYLRCDDGEVSGNDISGAPKPIYYINPNNETFRPFIIGRNRIRNATGGVGIFVETTRRSTVGVNPGARRGHAPAE